MAVVGRVVKFRGHRDNDLMVWAREVHLCRAAILESPLDCWLKIVTITVLAEPLYVVRS